MIDRLRIRGALFPVSGSTDEVEGTVPMKRLMLLSNSTNFAGGYLDHAMKEVLSFLEPAGRVLFVPFAVRDHAAYTERVRQRFALEGIEIESLATGAQGAAAIEEAPAIFVGGGNTFRLLDALQRTRFLEPIRRRAAGGIPYLGSSAGSVIAGPTLKTTNDMPIVQPQWFEALGLVPFQINAHYIDADPVSTHMGETREERIEEYFEENDVPVVGLREGAWLRVDGAKVRVGGSRGARIFRKGRAPVEVPPGATLDEWLGN